MLTNITIRQSGRSTPELETLAARRFQHALDRFSRNVRSLAVRVSDVNGPRGGVDKQCVVTIRLRHTARDIVIADVDQSASAVVSRVAGRAARAVARALDLGNDRRVACGW